MKKYIVSISFLILIAGMAEVAEAALSFTPASGALSAGTVSVLYPTVSLTPKGGVSPFTWAVTVGSLPPGLALSPTGNPGTISGTPTLAGNYSFSVTVTDKNLKTSTNNYTLVINPVITMPSSCPATLPQGTVGVSYSFQFAGNGGTTWSVTSGSLPPGLTLNSSGLLSGTPTTAGTYNFTVRYTGAGGTSATCACTLTIVSGVTCSFVGGISTGSISFSNSPLGIDPSLSGTIYGNVIQQISFTCSTNVAYTVTVNPASGWTLQSGANTMNYTLGTAPSGTYAGAPVNLLIPSGAGASSIATANYQNSPAGSYANASAITISVACGGSSCSPATIPSGSASGNVIDVCAVSQAPGTLTFNIDPSVSGTTYATISPDMQINCTSGVVAKISALSANGGATPRLNCSSASCGSAYIPYTFTILGSNSWPVSAPDMTGFGGTGASMQISGSVSSADYATAPIGTYTDVETVTINY